MKEELEQFKRGSGSAVRSEVSTAAVSGGSSTFAQPPPIDRCKIRNPFLATQDGLQRLDRSL